MVAVGLKNEGVWEHIEEPSSLLDVTSLCSMQSRQFIQSLKQTSLRSSWGLCMCSGGEPVT
jgi:hypothetical protein